MTVSLDSLPILPKQGDIITQGSAIFEKGIKTVSSDKAEEMQLKEEFKLVEEMNTDDLKEVFSALVETGVTLIPGVGEFLAPVVSGLLGNLLDVSDASELIQKKLNRIESKMDILDQQGKDNMGLIINGAGLKELQKVSAQLNDIWDLIKSAEKAGDGAGFKKAIESIDSANSVSSWLRVVDTMLMEKMPSIRDLNGNSINKGSLESVQSLLQDRVQSDTYCSTYTVMQYEKDVQEWLEYVSEIQTKGAALRILYQNSRLKFNPVKVSVKTVEGLVKDIVETHKKRIDSYRKALLGGILDYPSSKLLKELSQNDSNVSYPKLFSIKHEDSGLLFKIGRVKGSFKPSLLTTERGIDKYDSFSYKGVADKQELNASLGLIFNSDGRWSLRGSRYKYNLDHPSYWTVCRDDDDNWGNNFYGVSGEHLGLFGRNFASFKVIPRDSKPGEAPLVTLVLLDKNGSGRDRTWHVRLQESTALSTLTFCNTNTSVDVFEPFQRRSFFKITNYSQGNLKNVLVLQDLRIECTSGEKGQVYAPAMVWLPDQTIPITWASETQESIPLEGVIKMRAYRLKGDRDPSNQETVSKLLYINPSDGKLTLKEEGATALEDVFIKIWNPTGLSWNAVSSATRYCDNGEGVLPANGELHCRALRDTFDESGRRATQNDTGEALGAHVALKYSVSGGARKSSGWVEIRPRW